MLLHKNCTKKFNFKTIFHLSAFYAKLMKSDVEQEIRRSSTEAQKHNEPLDIFKSAFYGLM